MYSAWDWLVRTRPAWISTFLHYITKLYVIQLTLICNDEVISDLRIEKKKTLKELTVVGKYLGKYRERVEKNYEIPQPASPVIMLRLSTMNFPIRRNSTTHSTMKFDVLLWGTRLANTAILYTILFYPDWGFSTMTEVLLPWQKFFYHDWGFPVLFPQL